MGQGRALIGVVKESEGVLADLGLTPVLQHRGIGFRVVPLQPSATACRELDVLLLISNLASDGQVSNIERLRRMGLRGGMAVLVPRGASQLAERLLEGGADVVVDVTHRPQSIACQLAALARRVRAEWFPFVPRLRDGWLDNDACSVSCGGRSAQLTPTDFRLLACLARDFERWIPETRLVREVFTTHHAPGSSIVRVHICSLRKALRDLPLRIEQRKATGWRLVHDEAS